MIEIFQDFRRLLEDKAELAGARLVLATDNNTGDCGAINVLIAKYTKDQPIPFSCKGVYSPCWETHSEQRGLLMAVDPTFKSDWGLTNRIRELYDVPKGAKDHSHNPADDAYTIAFDQQVLYLIRDGKIKRCL